MGANRTKLSIAAVVLVAIAIGLMFFASGDGSETAGGRPDRPPVPVMVATVVMDEFVDSIEAVGTATANESIIVTAKVTEKLSSLNFEDGRFVEAGTIIAELTDDEAGADLTEARASLTEAQQQFERISGLFDRGNTTRAALDQAVSARDRAAARVEALEARMADRLIRAPFDGVLGLRMVSPGTLVRPGDEITTLDDISIIKLDFSVPETFLGSLTPGLEVTAKSAAYPAREFIGTISAIGTRIDPVTRTALVRAEIPNPDGTLKPGMLMTTQVLQNRRQSMKIPEESLVPINRDNFVFVVRDGERGPQIEQVKVEIGGRRPGSVEILDGLDLGDRVVTEGTNRVRPGAPVNILSSDARPAAEVKRATEEQEGSS